MIDLARSVTKSVLILFDVFPDVYFSIHERLSKLFRKAFWVISALTVLLTICDPRRSLRT